MYSTVIDTLLFYMFKFSVTYNHAQKQTNLNKQLHNITKCSHL